MKKRPLLATTLISALAFGPIVGCDDLPGGPREQGAVIGGLGGAAAGAAVAKNNRGVGALIGGLLGAGGGYLVGTQIDKRDEGEARRAAERAQANPARPEDVATSRTADLNSDGFVTLDEVVALEQAGLGNDEIVNRLEATNQVFALTEAQEEYLMNRGVDREVVVQMRDLNQAQLAGERISRPSYD